jgi:hypothetical protein
MEKLKHFKIDLMVLAMSILAVRAGIYGYSFGDSIAIAAFVAYYAWALFLNAKKQINYESLYNDKLKDLDNKINGLLVKDNIKPSGSNARKMF